MTSLFVIALATFGFNIHEGESVRDRAHLKSNIARRSDTHLRKQSKIGYNTMGNVVIEGNS